MPHAIKLDELSEGKLYNNSLQCIHLSYNKPAEMLVTVQVSYMGTLSYKQ